ncbi:hypothetical protein [Cellvibrio mixtus]|uniref:hypothetical protein n=1 Tax=Cellvibrio mixtus TaxID=39650 RepID=UPI000587B78A|nr:hypothetical protein [Cellvibrio mixtus]
MADQYRFLISFIVDNEPKTIEHYSNNDTLSDEEAETLVRKSVEKSDARITDIRVTGIHHPKNPKVHPGHYQQPEG